MTCTINTLTTCADKKGTYTIKVVFNGIPNSVTWTLYSLQGSALSTGTVTPALTVYITLSDTQLSITSGVKDVERVLTLTGTYNSTTPSFSNKPYTKEVRFTIKNYIGVANG